MPSPLELPRHPVVHGHPLHAMLSDLPAALVPAALVSEAWRVSSPGRATRLLSDAASGAALVAATAAGAVGWIDWLTMPTEHPAQRPATLHGVVNSTALLSLVAAVAVPARRLPLLGLATAAVTLGGWIGGDLVFRHGWRVRPVEEAEMVEKELDDAGQADYFARAREEVSKFEREKTFFGS